MKSSVKGKGSKRTKRDGTKEEENEIQTHIHNFERQIDVAINKLKNELSKMIENREETPTKKIKREEQEEAQEFFEMMINLPNLTINQLRKRNSKERLLIHFIADERNSQDSLHKNTRTWNDYFKKCVNTYIEKIPLILGGMEYFNMEDADGNTPLDLLILNLQYESISSRQTIDVKKTKINYLLSTGLVDTKSISKAKETIKQAKINLSKYITNVKYIHEHNRLLDEIEAEFEPYLEKRQKKFQKIRDAENEIRLKELRKTKELLFLT